MSSFICSEKDFRRITQLVVKGLNLYNLRDELHYGIKEDLEEAFGVSAGMIETNKDYVDAINDIYKKIKKMNYDAVFERYKKDYEVEFKKMEGFLPTGLVKHQDFKTLQCYLYQCSEGDVPETKIFKAIEKLKSRVAEYIVGNQPEYAEAKWGEYDEE